MESHGSLLGARPALAANSAGGVAVVSDPGYTARLDAVMADRFAAQDMLRE